MKPTIAPKTSNFEPKILCGKIRKNNENVCGEHGSIIIYIRAQTCLGPK